jgi:hypothetical protein
MCLFMMFDRLLQMWKIAAKDLGIEIVAPYLLTLPSGVSVRALLLVRNFGADKGMLVLSAYSDIDNCHDEIVSEGYGYSVLDEPAEDEPYSRQDFIELLKDWGWTGDSQPLWL